MTPVAGAINSNPSHSEGPISGLPKEIITCISSFFTSIFNTNPYAEAFKNSVGYGPLPIPGSANNEQMSKQMLQQKRLAGNKLTRFTNELSLVRSPWRDLASFGGTCMGIRKIICSNTYSKPEIQKEMHLANKRICTLKSCIATGEQIVATLTTRIEELKPTVILGIEFSIERGPPTEDKKCSIQ